MLLEVDKEVDNQIIFMDFAKEYIEHLPIDAIKCKKLTIDGDELTKIYFYIRDQWYELD